MADGIVALALIGGDERLERELVELSSSLGDVAMLPEAAADRADALLIADGQRGAALDRVRVELGARPGRRVLLVGAPGAIDPAEAMACGARGVLEYPLSAGRLRAALAAAGCLDEVHAPVRRRRPRADRAARRAGGCGVTTCAVAIAAATPHGVLVDLDLSSGDAAAVAGAPSRRGDALLALAYAPGIDAARAARPARRRARRRGSCRLRRCPSRPTSSTREASSQVLDAIRRAGIVADRRRRKSRRSRDAAGARARVGDRDREPAGSERAPGRRATSPGLLIRLGLADRPVGIVASRVWPHRRSEVRASSSRLVGAPAVGDACRRARPSGRAARSRSAAADASVRPPRQAPSPRSATHDALGARTGARADDVRDRRRSPTSRPTCSRRCSPTRPSTRCSSTARSRSGSSVAGACSERRRGSPTRRRCATPAHDSSHRRGAGSTTRPRWSTRASPTARG